MTTNEQLIAAGHVWPGNGASAVLIRALADALEEAEARLDRAEDIALGLDYAHDHARVQALVLLFDA